MEELSQINAEPQINAAHLHGNESSSDEKRRLLPVQPVCACAKEARIRIRVLSPLNDEGKLHASRVIAHEARNVILI